MLWLSLLSCSRTHNGISTGYISFEHDGLQREYLFHLPEEAPQNAPLLFVLHGYSDDAKSIRRYSKLNDIGDKNGFGVVYPRGTKDNWGLRFWNVGYTFHQDLSVNDSEFLMSLAEHLQTEYQLDANRTYMTGFSNGGDMSYMLACQKQDVFSAFVPVAGLMMQDWLQNCEPSKPKPIFAIHGTADDVTLYQGDLEDREGWGAYIGTEEVIQFWKQKNLCQQTEEEVTMAGEYSIVQTKHLECEADSEIWLSAIQNWRHDWLDEDGFRTSEELWSFLSAVQ